MNSIMKPAKQITQQRINKPIELACLGIDGMVALLYCNNEMNVSVIDCLMPPIDLV